jgi:hypothetical protein
VSLEAMVWALNFAPAPSPTAAHVLLGLANHAQPDGTDAFPSIARLVRYTRRDERTVRRALRELEDYGTIVASVSRVVDAKISRVDRRPNSYDLDMTQYRRDLSEEDLERMSREAQLAPHVALIRWLRQEEQRTGTDSVRGGTVPPRTPERGGMVPPRGSNGGAAVQERGGMVPPDTKEEPSTYSPTRELSPGENARPVDNSDRFGGYRAARDPRAPEVPHWRELNGPGTPMPKGLRPPRRSRPPQERRREVDYLQGTVAYEGRERRRAQQQSHQGDTDAEPS